MDGEVRVRALGQRLRALREARGETLEQVATVAGRSGGWLSRLENGHQKEEPSFTVLVALAGHFGVDVAELVRDGREALRRPDRETEKARPLRPDDPLEVVVEEIRNNLEIMAQLEAVRRAAPPEVFEEGLRALAEAWIANMRMGMLTLLMGLDAGRARESGDGRGGAQGGDA